MNRIQQARKADKRTRYSGGPITVIEPHAPTPEEKTEALRNELANILRCFDRDNIPARHGSSEDHPSVNVSITCRAAQRIRELLAQ